MAIKIFLNLLFHRQVNIEYRVDKKCNARSKSV